MGENNHADHRDWDAKDRTHNAPQTAPNNERQNHHERAEIERAAHNARFNEVADGHLRHAECGDNDDEWDWRSELNQSQEGWKDDTEQRSDGRNIIQ